MMSPSNTQEVQRLREQVSALVDGQLSGAELATAVQHALDDEEARESWRIYHLLGDVLRAPELARCEDDQAFVERLQQRLHGEVRPLAGPPQTRQVARRRWWASANDALFRWKLAAGLASFAAVAVTVWNLSGADLQVRAPVLAAGQATPTTVLTSPEGAEFASGAMIRDARLDELLAAHRQVGASPVWQSNSGFLRNATYVASPER